MRKRLAADIPVFISVFITAGILLSVFFWFKNKTDFLIDDTAKYLLSENAKARAASFSIKLKDQLVMLESQCRYFENVDMDDFDELKKTITATKGIGSFNVIGVIDKKGHGVDYNGLESDYSDEEFFQRAIKGYSFVSKTASRDSVFGDSLMLAVPVIQKSTVNGVVYGLFTKTDLNQLIETGGYREDTANLLIGNDGTIIARSISTMYLTDKITNFYETDSLWDTDGTTALSDIKTKLNGEKNAILIYKADSISWLVVLTPVGIHEWYYALIIPQSLITEQTNTISKNVVIVEIAVSMAFLLLLISILFLLRNNDFVKKTNEKFRMATSQTQTLVFDYDFSTRRLEFTGNVNVLSSEGTEVYERESVMELLKLVHPDDSAFTKEMLSLRTDVQTSVTREARVKCVDGLYYWYKLTGSIVRDSSGTAMRFVGNIINADEEISKERLLQQKAESDPLTGLLNKGAFEDYVTKSLASLHADDVEAFYIIDLDNFKKVNDSMGHVSGDAVLSDVARKLSLIFNDCDYVGRIGGDEFAAFLKLSESARKSAKRIIEEKAKSICAHIEEVYSDGSHRVKLSASVGVAVYPEHGTNYQDLYKNADSVLYRSKNNGKNQYTIMS